ncbi:MAG: hypothetical protein AAGC97_06795 [Planctomycetota bacterium]
MSDTVWDWWFGDGPRRRFLQRLRRWRLGRWMVVGGLGWGLSASADEPSLEALLMSAETVGFVMLEDDPLPDAAPLPQSEGGASDVDTERGDRLRELLQLDSPGGASTDQDMSAEDEARRQRLEKLLNDDFGGEVAGSDNEDDALDESSSSQFAEPFIRDALPEINGNQLLLPPLRAVSIDQSQIGNGSVPEDFNAEQDLKLIPLAEDGGFREPAFATTVMPWAAPNTYSHPLYFEDRMLERHGHERWGCMQPIAAGARFFTTIPMLPYLATLQDPCDTVYSKGYFRAGSPAPCLYQRPPYQKRAAVVEAAAIATGMIALP